MATPPDKPDAAAGVARAWHALVNHDGRDLVTPDLADLIRRPAPNGDLPTKNEILARLGEFKALVKYAEHGALSEAQWDAVARDPTLWELRWSWGDDSTPLRGYFHEPRVPGHQTVLAKVHAKEIVHGDDEGNRIRQNVHIDEASRRVAFGQPHTWGLGHSPQLFPSQ